MAHHDSTIGIRRRWILPLLAAGWLWLLPAGVAAAGAISQGFTTSDKVVAGSLMDLQSKQQSVAELADSQHADQLLGVVGSKSLVELSGGGQEIQVVTSGLTGILVSDINGVVKTGDKITASPIAGIGMRATNATTVVGTAQGDLSSALTSSRDIIDRQGKSHHVQIGTIPVQVNVTYYAANDDKLSPLVPSFLQTVSNSIVGHNVAALRVIVGMVALLLGFLTVAVMLYAAVRSGLIAIGRNPLAQSALRKGLLEVIITALGILILTLLITYIVLAT